MAERNYDQTGVQSGGDFIYLNIDGRNGNLYRTVSGERHPVPNISAYIDDVDIEIDPGNPQHDIKGGPMFILIMSATDPLDPEKRVKKWKLKMRSDYVFATPRFVNVLAGNVVFGPDNLISLRIYKKENYRSIFCAIEVNHNRDGKIHWEPGKGYTDTPRYDEDAQGFVDFWVDMFKVHVYQVIKGVEHQDKTTDVPSQERPIFTKLKKQTVSSLSKMTSVDDLEKKWRKAVELYTPLDSIEKELIRDLWTSKLHSFDGCAEWTLMWNGQVDKADDDLPF